MQLSGTLDVSWINIDYDGSFTIERRKFGKITDLDWNNYGIPLRKDCEYCRYNSQKYINVCNGCKLHNSKNKVIKFEKSPDFYYCQKNKLNCHRFNNLWQNIFS